MADQSRAEEMLCRWAEKKYNHPLGTVRSVYFDVGTHGPLSDDTPEEQFYVEVVMRFNHKSGHEIVEVDNYYTTGLIQEIVAFATEIAT